MKAWLEAGHYLAWACEPAAHPARSPSPHGMNRICSNQILSTHGTGEYALDAASVKELIEGGTVTGYAVYRKVAAGATGDAFYWYESVGASVGADGIGTAGRGTAACIGCHMGAGSDAEHSGHDFVYTQVQ